MWRCEWACEVRRVKRRASAKSERREMMRRAVRIVPSASVRTLSVNASVCSTRSQSQSACTPPTTERRGVAMRSSVRRAHTCTSVPDDEHVCNSCQRRSENIFFCDTCGIMQEPPAADAPVDLFGLFGVAERFDVDMNMLTSQFRLLQSQLHPDKWASKSDVSGVVGCDNLCVCILMFCVCVCVCVCVCMFCFCFRPSYRKSVLWPSGFPPI